MSTKVIELGIGLTPMDIQWDQTSLPKQFSSNCYSITFFNDGASVVEIDQVKSIAPGQAFVYESGEQKVLRHKFNINFTGGGVNNCIICMVIYA